MATTQPGDAHKRNAYRAERRRPASQSPFRDYRLTPRVAAARAMVEKREQELATLEAQSAAETRPQVQKILAQRILATKNNLESWLNYLADNSPREPRAVIIP